MKKLVVAYAVSVAVSLLGLVAVMSPYLAANGAPLSGKTGLSLLVAATISFWIFWKATKNAEARIHVRILHGIVASAVVPPLIVFSPLLVCIFVTHGACS